MTGKKLAMIELAEELPFDVLLYILLFFPVKSLLRFRCVSKTWCALLDSNAFIKRHMTKKTNLILQRFINQGRYLRYVGLYSLHLPALELALPINPINPFAKLIGSCNGLLCLYDENLGNIIVIWNPATRKHVKVTAPVTNKDCVVGFGYDSVSDDYKVVALVHFLAKGVSFTCATETNIYSLRSNSWRKIPGIEGYKINSKSYCGLSQILVCGALHWAVRKIEGEYVNSCISVVAFDLAKEEFKMIKLPNFSPYKYANPLICKLGSCLSVVGDYEINQDSLVDVWVMKDYGVTESWMKLFTLSSLETKRHISAVIPLVYSESGKEVLIALDGFKLFWYDLEKRTLKLVHVRDLFKDYIPVVCSESLVSLGGRAENDGKQAGEIED